MWRRREKTGTALYDESGCNMDMTRRSPGCGSQRLLRCRLHPAGRGPNSSSLFPPLAAVVAVAPNEGRLWHVGQVSPERVKLIYFVDCSAPLQRAAAA